MHARGFWFLSLALAVGLVAGCQSNESQSTDSEPPRYRFVEAWGGPGSGLGQLQEPIGIAIAGQEVFVSEAGNHRLQVFDRTGTAQRQMGPTLPDGDTLRRPMHIAPSGSTLYVPDFTTDRVHVFSRQGEFQRSLDGSGVPGGLDAPGGVAVDPNGRLYVTDFYHHRVLRFGPDGAFDRQWGTTDSTGKAPGRFTYPTDVAVLSDGGFVVADAYNHRIKRYTATDSLSWMRPKNENWADSTNGTFNVATAVATGPDGHIFVADFYNHRVQEFTSDGQFVQAFGEHGDGDGQFDRPVDLVFDEKNRLYVVDFGNDRLQIFMSDPNLK